MQPTDFQWTIRNYYGDVSLCRDTVSVNTRDDKRRLFPLSTKPFRQPPHPALILNALGCKLAFITLPMLAYVEPVGLLLSQLTRSSPADPR